MVVGSGDAGMEWECWGCGSGSGVVGGVIRSYLGFQLHTRDEDLAVTVTVPVGQHLSNQEIA